MEEKEEDFVIHYLPLECNPGLIIGIQGDYKKRWRLKQNEGQQIWVGNIKTTLGKDGYVQSTHESSYYQLECIEKNILVPTLNFGPCTVMLY